MPLQTNTRTTRRWVVLGLIAVAAIAAIIAAVVLATRDTTDPAPIPSSSRSASPSSGPTDSLPTGCLGGEERDAAMLTQTVGAAEHTSNGAVEVAASFVRWIQRFPYPPDDEVLAVNDEVLAAQSFTDDLASYLSARPDLSGGIVAEGTRYWMSTVPGVWHLESSSSDEVVVTIGTAFVVDGALSPTLRSSITVTVRWEDDGWRVSNADGTRTTQDLYEIGRPFAEGC
jgi:hypothetical protein